jgi:cell division cycle protein 20 (cofactor of APC complex)
MSSSINLENCFGAMAGTPTKSRPNRALQPASASNDRFIPKRSAMDLDVSHYNMMGNGADSENMSGNNVNASPAKEAYNSKLAQTLMEGNPTSKVLAFKNKAKPADVHESSLRVLYTQNREAGFQPKKYTRHIPQAPERILDAPELNDDYYLNLLDWSSTNVLGVALGDSIYLWNASDGTIQQLMQTQNEGTSVTSLSWIGQGNYMAVGTSDHKVQIWDVEKLKQVRQMDGHKGRVSSLAWNGPMLSSAGKDSTIVHHDVRQQQHKVGQLRGHTQEVCGLKWSPHGNFLASGGNDNLVNIWDDRYTSSAHNACETSLHRLDAHQAAV